MPILSPSLCLLTYLLFQCRQWYTLFWILFVYLLPDVSKCKLSSEVVRSFALLWPESRVQVKARTGIVLRWNIFCPHLFLVQHYLCWLYSFKFFHLFTAFVAALFQFLQNPFVFLFYTANFGTTAACHSFTSLLPYLTQWFLSQVLMCQLKHLNFIFYLFCWGFFPSAFQDINAGPCILLLHSWYLQKITTHAWLTSGKVAFLLLFHFCHLKTLHRDISIETIHGWNTCGQ